MTETFLFWGAIVGVTVSVWRGLAALQKQTERGLDILAATAAGLLALGALYKGYSDARSSLLEPIERRLDAAMRIQGHAAENNFLAIQSHLQNWLTNSYHHDFPRKFIDAATPSIGTRFFDYKFCRSPIYLHNTFHAIDRHIGIIRDKDCSRALAVPDSDYCKKSASLIVANTKIAIERTQDLRNRFNFGAWLAWQFGMDIGDSYVQPKREHAC